MRIEYQGHVEAEPMYSHVGYVSAYVESSVVAPNPTAAGVCAGLALLCAMVAARIADHGRSAVHWVGIACALAAVAVSLTGLAYALFHGSMSPRFITTIQHMERLSARTDAFEQQRGRPPTQDEWLQLSSPAERTDGLGGTLGYAAERSASAADGQDYVIATDPLEEMKLGVGSTHAFGPDGLFGTADDTDPKSELKVVLAEKHVNLAHFPHARQPRTGGAAHAHRVPGAR